MVPAGGPPNLYQGNGLAHGGVDGGPLGLGSIIYEKLQSASRAGPRRTTGCWLRVGVPGPALRFQQAI